MKIKNHRLYRDDDSPYPYQRSPNGGGTIDTRYLVIHFTAGGSAEQSVTWLSNPLAQASAHLVIGRDGKITQLMPFNQKAWHAGSSSWNGLTSLNSHSIGIELDNAGLLKKSQGKWKSWFGRTYPDDEVLVARHRNRLEESGWHTYTPEQLEVALEVSALLVRKYDLRDVLGHDDISPFRKVDPGPAFPMSSFRSRVMGRVEDEPDIYETITALNIRQGPGITYPSIENSPLPAKTRLEILDTNQIWKFVDVLDPVNKVSGLQGWVHGNFIRLKEEAHANG